MLQDIQKWNNINNTHLNNLSNKNKNQEHLKMNLKYHLINNSLEMMKRMMKIVNQSIIKYLNQFMEIH